MIKIKICGITNVDDACFALEKGADYLGLIFAQSKRKIIKETGRRIIGANSSFKNYVGVFMNGRKKDIDNIAGELDLRILQFHGDETPAFCNYFINRGYSVIKVFRVRDARSVADVEKYSKLEYVMFDTFAEAAPGGTGKTFDWTLLNKSDALKDKKLFLSGGLSAANVRSAIDVVHPFAVDASSLLEKSPGIKDHNAVAQFISAVRI